MSRLPALLEDIQSALFKTALEFRDQNTRRVTSVAELEAHFAERRGFVALPWKDDAAAEAAIKEKTGATLRCIPLDQKPFAGLSTDGAPVALFARAY